MRQIPQERAVAATSAVANKMVRNRHGCGRGTVGSAAVLPLAAPCNATRNSVAEAKRSAGLFCKHRSTIEPSADGTPAGSAGVASRMIDVVSSYVDSPRNG